MHIGNIIHKTSNKVKVKIYDSINYCFPVGSHWLEHSVQMLKSGKAELVHEVDETFIDIRTSFEDINNKSNFLHIYQSFHTVFLIIQRLIQRICAFVLLDFSLTVKAVTLIFISGRGLAISSAKEGKSGFIYYLVKSK